MTETESESGIIKTEDRFLLRVQPYIGSGIVVLGLVQFTGMLLSDSAVPMGRGLGGVAMGLFMAGAGLGMVHKRARGRQFWTFMIGSLAIATLIVMALL